MAMAIVFAILGVFAIFTGVKLLVTGKLSPKEEEKLKTYSQKGARTYKLMYAAFSIISGLVVIGSSVVRFLEGQGIIEDRIWHTIVLLAVLGVMIVAFLLIRNKCKKMTDDE